MEPSNTTEVIAKPWYASRTLWLNLLGLIVLVVGVIVDNAQLVDLPPEMLGYLGMVLAIANAVLRFVTTQPIASGSGHTAVVEAPRIITEQAAAPPMPHVDIPPGGFRG